MKRCRWIVFGVLILSAASVSAEIYKYVDKDGKVLYTDDVSMIPEEQRTKAGVFSTPEGKVYLTPEDAEQPQEQPEATTTETDNIEEIRLRLENEQEALVKEAAILEKEREALRKEKEELLSSRRFKSGTDSIIKRKFKALNERLEASQKKMEAYEKKQAAYEAEVKAIKARLQQTQSP